MPVYPPEARNEERSQAETAAASSLPAAAPSSRLPGFQAPGSRASRLRLPGIQAPSRAPGRMDETTPLTGSSAASWARSVTPQRLRVLTVLALLVAMAIYIGSAAAPGPSVSLKAASPTAGWPSGLGTTDAAARKDHVTFVPGFGTPLEKQYAGLVTVNPQAVGRLFYWFFEISDASKNNDMTPLIVWLNGGPGASSMTGLLAELGPYRLTKDGHLIPNPYSWSSVGHLLFFDQPVGTGYSTVRDDNGYVTNQDDMAQQLYRAIQGFLELHPEYVSNPMFICGESYAGKYVPSISHYIHERNAELALGSGDRKSSDDVVVNLKGVAIGNGEMWPVLQTRSVPDYALALGLIDSQQYEQANADISLCEEFHRQGRHVDAFQVCQSVLDQIYVNAGNPFVYDIRQTGNVFDNMSARLSSYFNSDAVRAALNVPQGTLWRSVDGSAYGTSPTAPPLVRHLLDDEMLDVSIDVFRDLLDSYKFLFYAGNMDGSVCNNLGVGRIIDRLAWTGTPLYRAAPRRPWSVDGQVAGLAKSAGNMSYVVVTNAGHLVPMDQPAAALDMIRRFVNNEPFYNP